MVPGVQVARMGNARWAVSARGFNGRFANKLLVLMDGRSIYSPLFSGVLWEQEDTLLEDIDRVEVIRGPGAAMWGANAVNGVINIITKRARATQGGLATASAGNEDRAAGALRWGGTVGESGNYRVWAKGLRRESSDDALNIDASHSTRAGFRTDSTLGGGSRDLVDWRNLSCSGRRPLGSTRSVRRHPGERTNHPDFGNRRAFRIEHRRPFRLGTR